MNKVLAPGYGEYVVYECPNGEILLDWNENLWKYGYPAFPKHKCKELERGVCKGGTHLPILAAQMREKYAKPKEETNGDPRLKYIVENLEDMKIGVDDPFQFHCNQCGKCCLNREDILLNPKDVYNIARELGLEPHEVIEKYCDTYVGRDSRIPITRLMPKGAIKRCPLLKGNKCSVHNAKPVVCAMYPIGRCVLHDKNAKETGTATEAKIEYILNPPDCGDKSETHTVREWLEKFGIPEQDEAFLKWQAFMMASAEIIRRLEKVMSDDLMSKIWTAFGTMIYMNYETDKEFLPQFEKNADSVLKLLRGMDDIAKGANNND